MILCLGVRNTGAALPIYEYEPVDRDCLICEGRTEVMQAITDEALEYCPTCGLEVRRVVSRASFKLSQSSDPDRAAAKGFTTFKRVEKGKWERIAGEGPDVIAGSQADMDAVDAESKPAKKVLDLDA
jgi:putative FmdB family regulatory protein